METISRMFDEMGRTLNAVGDYSESEYETDEDEIPEASSSSRPVATQPVETTQTPEDGDAPVKKKKKKRKKKAANKPDLEDLLNNVNLEELEKEDPYDISKSVAERMELAVTRFRKNRKFNPERAQILSTYLDYGGIRTGPKMFQGGGASNTPGVTDNDTNPGDPDYEAMNAGIDSVDLPEDGQVIDFTNVVTTFLSEHFLKNTGWIDMTYHKDTPLVIAALLNYLLLRNVLPEHEEDLRAALKVAEQAQVELPLCKQINNSMPGLYDKACSLLYGGEWYGHLDQTWTSYETNVESLGMDRAMAEAIVQSLIGPDADLKNLSIISREDLDLEIIHIDFPDEPQEPEENNSDKADFSDELATEDDPELVAMVDRMLLGSSAPSFNTSESGLDQTNSSSNHPASTIPSEFGPIPSSKNKPVMPVPMFANVTFAEWDRYLLREEQKPLDQRRKFHVYFDPSTASKMLLSMRVVGIVYTLSNGMSYLEQAAIYPTYYLEAEVDETPDDAYEEWSDNE
ncbi:hypothetical protein BX616_011141 [Lobosporangium transversale]|nr:hypothetical protein BX616_011141 [Lobosporangium transversale]